MVDRIVRVKNPLWVTFLSLTDPTLYAEIFVFAAKHVRIFMREIFKICIVQALSKWNACFVCML